MYKEIAERLMRRLKSGELKKIGIEEVREAISAHPLAPTALVDKVLWEKAICRALVEMS